MLLASQRRLLLARTSTTSTATATNGIINQRINLIKNNNNTLLHQREYQTAFKPGMKVTIFDSISQVYEDPKYKLDLKPIEFRDGQINSYNMFGANAVVIPSVIAAFICFFCLAWYTLFDPEVQFLRSNPHAFLEIKTGRELYYSRVPIFTWTRPWGPGNHLKFRELFQAEIADALERRYAADQAAEAAGATPTTTH